MLRAVRPGWTLDRATRDTRGHTAVYHLEVATADGSRELVLKASPDEAPRGVTAEPRLLGLLARETGIPVPEVVAAVDAHEAVPAPYFLMDSMPGTAREYEETRLLDDHVLRRLARETGEYLGRLHGLDVVDAFGVVGVDAAEGPGRPAAPAAALGVPDPIDTWTAFLRASVEPELEQLAASDVADVAADVRSRVEDRLSGLSDRWRPVLGRIDHGVHNLLMRPADGGIEALIDWGFTLAVTPGCDLRTVEYVLSGAVLAPLADATDRRPLVRTAMAEGYRRTARYPDAELAAAGDLYELLAVLRAMNHLEAGIAKLPDGSEATVARRLRTDLERLVD